MYLLCSRLSSSNSSNMSPTWLNLHHLLQTHLAAVHCTFSIRWMLCCLWGFQIWEVYSTWGLTMDLYIMILVCCGAKHRFRLRKPSVLVALPDTLSTCFDKSSLLLIVTPRYFEDSVYKINKIVEMV